MQKAILFLLRTYNDIDHIAPVIWKAVVSARCTYFMFVDRSYLDDYRIRFLIETGARHLRCPPMTWYHQRIRRWLGPRFIRRIVDRLIAYTIGTYLLKRNSIRVVASEWSGVFGREMAEYILRPANRMRLRCVSLPHGYIIWRNNEINELEVNLWRTKQKRPDFSERNIFSAYVVQSEDACHYYLARGISREKIRILGSARFCPEWFSINNKLMKTDFVGQNKKAGLVVLFFVPDWEYNVDRQACVILIKNIAEKKNVSLLIKVNTRGTGSFSKKELAEIREHINVTFPSIDEHSTSLIKSADIVVNFASSIGQEAILQRKPVCNPVYLNGNATIFDKSGVVFDAKDDEEVLSFFDTVKAGRHIDVSDETLDKFLGKYVSGGEANGDILRRYVDLLSIDVINSDI